MEQQAVDPGVQPMLRAFRNDRRLCDGMRGKPALRLKIVRPPCGWGLCLGDCDRLRKFGQSAAAYRHCRDHRHAKFAGQRRGIDYQPVARRQIDHVKRNHHRAAQFDHFQRKHQMLFKVRGIEHQHQHFGRRLTRKLAKDNLAGNLFIGTGSGQSVAAGQISQFNRLPRWQHQSPGLALNRDARIVGDLLPRSGQRIEQRAFARVRVADQRSAAPFAHAGAPASVPASFCAITSICITRA